MLGLQQALGKEKGTDWIDGGEVFMEQGVCASESKLIRDTKANCLYLFSGYKMYP